MTPDILHHIADVYGTPTYVYDLARVRAQYTAIKTAFPWPGLKICYAMKANYNRDILACLKQMGSGIDAVSPGDIHMALACGFKPRDLIYTANNITDREMDEVMATGILMNIDSLSRLEKYGRAYPNTRVCLRFNPDVVDGEFDGIKTGGDLTKFGILIEDAKDAAALAEKYGLTVAGLHEHTGSGLQKADSVLNAMDNILAVARAHFPDLEFIDLGGGFKVPYRPEETPLDVHEMGRAVVERFAAFCREFGRELGLWLEPGKYLTAQAGVLLTRVNTVKRNRTRTVCGTDSGFPQLIRPMFYGAYHDIGNLSNPDGPPAVCDICGNICETGDLFARERTLPEVLEGHLLAVRNAGAYCYAMGGTYNLRPMPAEVVVDGRDIRLSRRRLTPRELVAAIIAETPDDPHPG